MPARGLVSEVDRLRSLCGELGAEQGRLRARLAHYADENEALRASAFLWIGLYERQVARANALVDVCRLRGICSSEGNDSAQKAAECPHEAKELPPPNSAA